MNGTPSQFPAAPQSWPSAEPRPRVWPGVILVALLWTLIKVPGWIAPGTALQIYAGFFGSMIAIAAIVLWWLLVSRVRWTDRFLVALLCGLIGFTAFQFYDPDLRRAGFIGITFNILPVVLTGTVAWLLISRSAGRSIRLAGLFVVFLVTWGAFELVRFEGVDGYFVAEYSLRWNPSAEQHRIAERAAANPATAAGGPAKPIEVTPGDWPGFRGPARDGRRTGVRILTDWKTNPPKEVWRHRIGPGWSSFAVVASRLYTQEQLGNVEMVVCYSTDTGDEVWAYKDESRFEEAVSGAGPRATPTYHEGRLYALGARGRLNCLDAATGNRLWTRDVVTDSGRDQAPTEAAPAVPLWGFSASPLVVQGIVTVFAGGPNGKSVLGYRADTGELAWAAGEGTNSYCSMHPARVGGGEQIVVSSEVGLEAYEPATGKALWQFNWDLGKDFGRVVQPTQVGDRDFLLGSGFGKGTKRVRVTKDSEAWNAQEVWSTTAISPYFNDVVIHKDHIYGLSGGLLVCVRLEDGKLKWKERGYDNGQVLLLPDQDLLVVQCEKGDVALVEAKPDRRNELGRIKALKSKTWNHPVIAHGKLFVRNGEEMACFQLTPEGRSAEAGQ